MIEPFYFLPYSHHSHPLLRCFFNRFTVVLCTFQAMHHLGPLHLLLNLTQIFFSITFRYLHYIHSHLHLWKHIDQVRQDSRVGKTWACLLSWQNKKSTYRTFSSLSMTWKRIEEIFCKYRQKEKATLRWGRSVEKQSGKEPIPQTLCSTKEFCNFKSPPWGVMGLWVPPWGLQPCETCSGKSPCKV